MELGVLIQYTNDFLSVFLSEYQNSLSKNKWYTQMWVIYLKELINTVDKQLKRLYMFGDATTWGKNIT